MKKNYIQPSVLTAEVELSTMICRSKGVRSNQDIDYGGIDEDGGKDPASRQKAQNIWEDEEEDDY